MTKRTFSSQNQHGP